MALTYSEMISLGKKAPSFTLLGIDGKRHRIDDLAKNKKATVVMFLCSHCPYVQAVQDRIAKLADDYTSKGIQFIAICSNDFQRYPEDSPENLKIQAKEVGFHFPYLIDESQDVARSYGAVCTPDIFVFDSTLKLRYRGRIDDNWKEPTKVKRYDLQEALDALISDQPVSVDQKPSMGCSIKWKM